MPTRETEAGTISLVEPFQVVDGLWPFGFWRRFEETTMSSLKSLLIGLSAALLLAGCGNQQGADDTGATGQPGGDSGMNDTAPGTTGGDATMGTPDATTPPSDPGATGTTPGTDPGTSGSAGDMNSTGQPGNEGNTGETDSSTPSQ
jgi:hypothetical protein